MRARPPWLAEWLLASWLPPDEAEFVLGDLAEAFALDREHGRHGATLRYWNEALAAAWHLRSRQSRPRLRRQKDSSMATFLVDLVRAGKTLRRSPGFTLATVLITALGLGATTAIFSVVNPILLRGLPYESPEKLVMVWERDADGSNSRTGYTTFRDLSTESQTLTGSAVMGSWMPTISGGDGDPERLLGQRVSWEFFDVLGVKPALGRPFVAAEDAPDVPRTVILTHGLWQRRFGADSSIVGGTVTLNGTPVTVAGVLRAGFDDVFQPGTQIYRILGYDVSQPWACRTCRHLQMIGRIKDDVTREAAGAELSLLSQRLVEAHATEYPAAGVNLVPVQTDATRQVRPALLSVLVASLFLLLIASANVVNLQLARSARRKGEFAVRAALGARRGQLARQLLAEGMLLALLGGVAGVLIARVALTALVAQLPADIPRLMAVRLDLASLGFAGLATLVLGALAGLAPLASTRSAAFQTLRGAARALSSRRHAGRAGIVVAEVALALMLLVGTGLLARSLAALLAVNPGFEPDRLLTMEIQSSGPAYANDAAVWRYHDQVREVVAALPGVLAAEVTTQVPLGGNFDGNGILAQDKPLQNPELAPGGQRYAVSSGYLGAMRIPLVRGRDFTALDASGSAPEVVIVSASLAQRIWPGEDAIGKRIQVGGGNRPWLTVVGVAGDVRHTGLDATELNGFYVPERQWYWADNQVVLVVRAATDPAGLASSVIRAVRSIDPAQPITRVRTGAQVVLVSTGQRRLALVLFAAFAIAAVLLAAAGVYGVLALAVTERRREIGIRSALGATPRAIVNLVLRQGLGMAGVGLVLGLAGAMALTRYLQAMLFRVGPADPASLVSAAALLVGVALAACLVPAWRALRVNPVTTLGAE